MSASRREVKRHETSARLMRCALELCRDRGFDGWTMDDLAERAEVARRTVFNYFDSKTDVVLGPKHEPPAHMLATFVAGGPTGNIVDDVIALAAQVMQDKGADLELIDLRRAAILADPHLAALINSRFEEVIEETADHIVAREGEEYGAYRARLLIKLLVTIFENALLRLRPDENTPLEQFLADAVAEARSVLNP